MAGEYDSVFLAARTASRGGDIPQLRALLLAHSEVAAATDADEWTLLHCAAFYGHCAAAVELLLAAAPATAAAHTRLSDTPLHLAALGCHIEVAAILLRAAPATAQAADTHGYTALHHAAAGGDAATARLLLAAAPATALAVNANGRTPLHGAARCGDMATVQLLLAAAPATAAAVDRLNQTPLHIAAGRGRTAVAQALLAAAPPAADIGDANGRTPLKVALLQHYVTTARCLLPFGSGPRVLTALAQAGQQALPLFADFVIARPPLTAQEWARVPAPCPGLGRALPAALAHSPFQAYQVVCHLPAADVQRLRTAALCLARAQQRTRVPLPAPLVQQVLGLAMS